MQLCYNMKRRVGMPQMKEKFAYIKKAKLFDKKSLRNVIFEIFVILTKQSDA